MLGHNICGAAFQSAYGRRRRNIHDVGRRSLLQEYLDRALAAQVDRALVGLIFVVIDFLGGLMYRQLSIQYSGIINQDIQMPEFFKAGIEHSVNLLWNAHVRLKRQDAACSSFCLYFCLQRFQPIQPAGRSNNLGAFHCKNLCAGAPNARTCARDNDCFSFKSHTILPPFSNVR